MNLETRVQPTELKEFNFDSYMAAQRNYIQDLYYDAVAKKDVDYKTTVSQFTNKFYFAKGYDDAYRQYYCGMRHKPKWGEL